MFYRLNRFYCELFTKRCSHYCRSLFTPLSSFSVCMHSKKAWKFWKNIPFKFDVSLVNVNGRCFSNFVAFLGNPNFKCAHYTKRKISSIMWGLVISRVYFNTVINSVQIKTFFCIISVLCCKWQLRLTWKSAKKVSTEKLLK